MKICKTYFLIVIILGTLVITGCATLYESLMYNNCPYRCKNWRTEEGYQKCLQECERSKGNYVPTPLKDLVEDCYDRCKGLKNEEYRQKCVIECERHKKMPGR
jgi:hypothetical protein